MIKFIFTTLLIIFFIRLVAPVLFKWLLGMFIRKKMRNGAFFYNSMNQQQQQQANGHSNGSSKQAKGDVRIDFIPEQPADRKGFDGGEYVDYEEVK